MLTETKITPKLQHNTLMDDIMDYLPNKSAQSKTATKPLSLNEILKQNSLIQQNKPQSAVKAPTSFHDSDELMPSETKVQNKISPNPRNMQQFQGLQKRRLSPKVMQARSDLEERKMLTGA